MKITRLLLLAVMPMMCLSAHAQTFSYNVFAGVDRYFKMKNIPNLMWYTGLRVGMAYAQNQMKYDEYESMGKSVGESWNLRGSITMGVDY